MISLKNKNTTENWLKNESLHYHKDDKGKFIVVGSINFSDKKKNNKNHEKILSNISAVSGSIVFDNSESSDNKESKKNPGLDKIAIYSPIKVYGGVYIRNQQNLSKVEIINLKCNFLDISSNSKLKALSVGANIIDNNKDINYQNPQFAISDLPHLKSVNLNVNNVNFLEVQNCKSLKKIYGQVKGTGNTIYSLGNLHNLESIDFIKDKKISSLAIVDSEKIKGAPFNSEHIDVLMVHGSSSESLTGSDFDFRSVKSARIMSVSDNSSYNTLILPENLDRADIKNCPVEKIKHLPKKIKEQNLFVGDKLNIKLLSSVLKLENIKTPLIKMIRDYNHLNKNISETPVIINKKQIDKDR